MQTKKHSLIESATNTGTGILISFIISFSYYYLKGVKMSILDNIELTILMTIASLLRSYWVRRKFNKKSKDNEMIEFVLNKFDNLKADYIEYHTDWFVNDIINKANELKSK